MRLIDADALIEFIDSKFVVSWKHDYDGGFKDACIAVLNAIEDAPTIDAVEVVHGEWIGYNADKGSDWLRFDGEPIFLVCNKCHGMVMNNASLHWNFCPNCGAKMDGEREGE